LGRGGLALPDLLMFTPSQEAQVLWTIAVVLVVLWLLGQVTSQTMGGFIHILLVLAIIAVLFRIITGRKAV
jgi:hypothetical protein